ncbi:MAG: hypothetical protein IPK33_16420 [Gemmatimonadetes bacterium]|nr:hypothetical protein [Gemmatimonadota bacterium]
MAGRRRSRRSSDRWGTIFLQQVVAGPASLLAKFAGDGTAGLAGAGVRVVVKVTDVHGNAVSG